MFVDINGQIFYVRESGGPGSGNWGHLGIPGYRGGSQAGSGGVHARPDNYKDKKGITESKKDDTKVFRIVDGKIVLISKQESDKLTAKYNKFDKYPEFPKYKNKDTAIKESLKIVNSNRPISEKIELLNANGIYISSKTTPGYLYGSVLSSIDLFYDVNGHPIARGAE